MFANMDAIAVLNDKQEDDDGFIVEMVIWRVPVSVPPSTHLYKYRMFFGRHGQRIVCYDNERGKGDHRHIDGVELGYSFVDVPTLIADFSKEMAQWKKSNAR